jgi:NTP pyrophosphatase (non-canonical NTP hydrolase)
MNLNELAADIHTTAVEKGWWGTVNPFAQQCANFHGEVSEAWEEWRKGRGMTEVYYLERWSHSPSPYPSNALQGGWVATDEERNTLKPEGIPIELADIIIRVLDTCDEAGIDIEAAVRLKMEYNKTRPHRHGGKRA